MPLLLPQALWVKRTALRLPEAAQPWTGLYLPPESSGSEQPLRLLLVGESTVAGVGVETQSEALSGQLASQLAQVLKRPVQWQACGRNGATATDCLTELLPQLQGQRWDLVLLVLGVNDTTHLSSRRHWRRAMAQLVEAFAGRAGQCLITGVPPLGHFQALPQPLRAWFGLRAGLLDADLRALASHSGAGYLPLNMAFEPAFLARDGYHPSALGYAHWASGIVQQLGYSSSSTGPSGSSP